MTKRAVFIDRDGTLNEEVGYINHVSRLMLLPRAAEAVRKLNEAGVPAVVISNQAGVARGYFPEERVIEVNDRLKELLSEQGARLDGLYYCPHHPDGVESPYRRDCDCRKPKTGMIDLAARELDLDVAGSYMVGDRFGDIRLARAAGCKGVMVLTGYGRGAWEHDRDRADVYPDYVAVNLLDAVEWLIEDIYL